MEYAVHGILRTTILEWVAFPFSRAFSQPRDRTQVYLHCKQTLYRRSHREALRLRADSKRCLAACLLGLSPWSWSAPFKLSSPVFFSRVAPLKELGTMTPGEVAVHAPKL